MYLSYHQQTSLSPQLTNALILPSSFVGTYHLYRFYSSRRDECAVRVMRQTPWGSLKPQKMDLFVSFFYGICGNKDMNANCSIIFTKTRYQLVCWILHLYEYRISNDSPIVCPCVAPFCMNMYLDMVNTTGGAIAWAFLKPMLMGHILYTPDTPATRAIMEKV